MRRSLLAATFAVLPAIAGADIGIGASLRDSEAALYLPIESNATLRIEPFFAWLDQDLTGPVDVSTETLTLGVGIFRKLEIRDRAQVYLGGRLGYSRFEGTTTAASPPDLETDGYIIEPTLGIEYRIVDQVAISLEALVFIHSASEDFGGDDYDRHSVGTANRILLRVYFPP